MGAEAATGDDEEVGIVGETIKAGRGEEGIAEEVGPFGDIAVGGDEDAALLVTGIDNVAEVFRGGEEGGAIAAKVPGII